MSINQLLLGDNLEILRSLDSDSIDLIYLDPPFFSNRTYEVIWGDKGEVRSFEDRFSGGIDHYIAWLKERVEEMYRVLKPTGSIFLHCDWHANAEIKVHILNKVFGSANFRGEIVWKRHNAHNKTANKLSPITDTIWFYSKHDRFKYNPIYAQKSEDELEESFQFEDEKGRYTSTDLTGSGTRKGESSIVWKGYDPNTRNRHWAIPIRAMKGFVNEDEIKLMNTEQKLELLDANKLILFTSNGTPRFKRYLEVSKGALVGNLWSDIQNVQAISKERIGYPTQKPIALLERIIKMASNEGDVILDPFVGGGTTVAVADKLHRRWIGIDQSVQAIKVAELRLYNQVDLFSQPFLTKLHKYDYDTLRHKDAFQFETFAVTTFGGRPNIKQRGDLGLDGRTLDNTPIQVKRSDTIGRNVVDNFLSAVQRYDKQLFEKNIREGKPVGYIIAFSFGKGAIEEAARLKNNENIIIKLIKVEDFVPIAKKPILHVSLSDKGKDAKGAHTIEFMAKAESTVGIEFFSWDFDYKDNIFKAEVLLDKSGVQSWKFKPGLHIVAVKVVDNDGLESVEVLKLKVNGKIERQG